MAVMKAVVAAFLVSFSLPAFAFEIHSAEVEDIAIPRRATRVAAIAHVHGYPGVPYVVFNVVNGADESIYISGNGRPLLGAARIVYRFGGGLSSESGMRQSQYNELRVLGYRQSDRADCPIYFDVERDLDVIQAIVPTCSPQVMTK